MADYLLFWWVFVSLAGATWLFVRWARRQEPSRGRLIAGNGLILLSLLAGVALLAETYLRFVYDATDSYGLTLTNRAWMHRNWQRNSMGLRDIEWQPAKAAGTRRVAFLGDSFVAGYGVSDPEDRLGNLVRRELAGRAPPRYEVWNCAELAWSTKEQTEFMSFAASRLGLDHVILGYCLNDVHDLLPPDQRFDRDTLDRPTWISPTQSFLFDFLWFRTRLAPDDRFDRYFGWVDRAYGDPELWNRQRARLRRLVDVTRSRGARMDVVVFPFFDTWGPGYAYGPAHEQVGAAFRELGVNVLDLRAAYAGIPGDELVVNRFDAHPNERAHRIAADAILDALFAGR